MEYWNGGMMDHYSIVPLFHQSCCFDYNEIHD
jgi:hypothetical protein